MIKKIKQKVTELQDWIDTKIQSMLGGISPDGRVFIVLAMLLVFGGASIFMTVSSIYNMGKNKGRQIEIEHIQGLELGKKQTTDSITNKNKMRYEFRKPRQ